MTIDFVFGAHPKADASNDNFFRWYGDVNGDGVTNFSDIASGFLSKFGSSRP